MASYLELFDLMADTGMRNRVLVANLVAAITIRGEDVGTPNHANRLRWAKEVFERPEEAAQSMLRAVLGEHNAFTREQILNASDGVLQTAVNKSINVFAVDPPAVNTV